METLVKFNFSGDFIGALEESEDYKYFNDDITIDEEGRIIVASSKYDEETGASLNNFTLYNSDLSLNRIVKINSDEPDNTIIFASSSSNRFFIGNTLYFVSETYNQDTGLSDRKVFKTDIATGETTTIISLKNLEGHEGAEIQPVHNRGAMSVNSKGAIAIAVSAPWSNHGSSIVSITREGAVHIKDSEGYISAGYGSTTLRTFNEDLFIYLYSGEEGKMHRKVVDTELNYLADVSLDTIPSGLLSEHEYLDHYLFHTLSNRIYIPSSAYDEEGNMIFYMNIFRYNAPTPPIAPVAPPSNLEEVIYVPDTGTSK